MAKEPTHELRNTWLDVAYTPNEWGVGNDYLYSLCKKYPGHTDSSEVLAKIWLIGRAYSAAAERGISGKGNSDNYLISLSQQFVDNNIDTYFLKLPKYAKNFNNHLETVVKTHHEIESIFSNNGKLGRVSLTSKYLHFHYPNLFPIYDSRAAKAINKVTPDSRYTGHELTDNYASLVYGKFSARCAWLIDLMTRETGTRPTLRQLDTMLLKINRDL